MCSPAKMLNRFIFVLLLILALASGLSEPLCRNSARIIFFITAIKFFTDQRVLDYVIRRRRFILLMIAFVGWMIVSSFYSGHVPSTEDSSTYWLYFSYNMLLFVPIGLFVERERWIDWIFLVLAISLMLNNMVIEVQLYYGSDRPVTFLRGAFMQSAILYVVLLPIYLILALRARTRAMKILCWSFFLLSFGAFILLKTRGALLTMLVILPSMILFFVRDVKRLLAIAALFILSATVFFSVYPEAVERIETVKNFDAEQSVSERFLMWRSALEMIGDNPMMGVGFGNFEQKYQREYIQPEARERWQGHAHNTYLQLWAETGLIGLAIYCSMFGYILVWSWRRRSSDYAAMIFFSTAGFLMYSMTDYTYASYSAMRVYWFVFGLCVRGVDFSADNG